MAFCIVVKYSCPIIRFYFFLAKLNCYPKTSTGLQVQVFHIILKHIQAAFASVLYKLWQVILYLETFGVNLGCSLPLNKDISLQILSKEKKKHFFYENYHLRSIHHQISRLPFKPFKFSFLKTCTYFQGNKLSPLPAEPRNIKLTFSVQWSIYLQYNIRNDLINKPIPSQNTIPVFQSLPFSKYP